MRIPEEPRKLDISPDDLVDLLRSSAGISCIFNEDDESQSILITLYDKDGKLREYVITKNVVDIVTRLRADIAKIMNRIDE